MPFSSDEQREMCGDSCSICQEEPLVRQYRWQYVKKKKEGIMGSTSKPSQKEQPSSPRCPDCMGQYPRLDEKVEAGQISGCTRKSLHVGPIL